MKLSMNNMPPKLRRECAKDPFYQRCCITGELGKRGDRIEWHHNLIYAGRQHQAKFSILPVKKSVHSKVSNQSIKQKLDWVMLNRASDEEILSISKAKDYFLYRDFLNKRFGSYPHIVHTPHLSEIAYPWLNEAIKNV